MRAIRKVDTKPELAVRRTLHAMGVRFRLHRSDLPGSPDIVLSSRRAIIMVHGCFWHQHRGCRYAKLPRARPEYWLPKLERNVARDAWVEGALIALGWRVLIVWECNIEQPGTLRRQLERFLLRGDERA